MRILRAINWWRVSALIICGGSAYISLLVMAAIFAMVKHGMH